MNCQVVIPGIKRDKIAAKVQKVLDTAHLSRTATLAALRGTPVNEILSRVITEAVLQEINFAGIIVALHQMVEVRPGSGDYHQAVRQARAALEHAHL